MKMCQKNSGASLKGLLLTKPVTSRRNDKDNEGNDLVLLNQWKSLNWEQCLQNTRKVFFFSVTETATKTIFYLEIGNFSEIKHFPWLSNSNLKVTKEP